VLLLSRRADAQREPAQVALPWVPINLHLFYLTGAAGNYQAGAWGWEPAEVTPGCGWQGRLGLPWLCWACHPLRCRAGRVGVVGKC